MICPDRSKSRTSARNATANTALLLSIRSTSDPVVQPYARWGEACVAGLCLLLLKSAVLKVAKVRSNSELFKCESK